MVTDKEIEDAIATQLDDQTAVWTGENNFKKFDKPVTDIPYKDKNGNIKKGTCVEYDWIHYKLDDGTLISSDDLYYPELKDYEDDYSQLTWDEFNVSYYSLFKNYDKIRRTAAMNSGEYNETDGLKYPVYNHIDEDDNEEIYELVHALHNIEGIESVHGCMYNYTPDEISVAFPKALFFITFKDGLSLNRFGWAGCYRYFPLSKSNKWSIRLDTGDPRWNDKNIHMQLCYYGDGSEWREDFKKMIDGLKKYHNDKKDISLED